MTFIINSIPNTSMYNKDLNIDIYNRIKEKYMIFKNNLDFLKSDEISEEKQEILSNFLSILIEYLCLKEKNIEQISDKYTGDKKFNEKAEQYILCILHLHCKRQSYLINKNHYNRYIYCEYDVNKNDNLVKNNSALKFYKNNDNLLYGDKESRKENYLESLLLPII